jgi:hypothetical protein
MTVGELILMLYKFNPNLPIVIPTKEQHAGSSWTGVYDVNIESTIDEALDLETRVVLTLKII